jgi:hypothetical protein
MGVLKERIVLFANSIMSYDEVMDD